MPGEKTGLKKLVSDNKKYLSLAGLAIVLLTYFAKDTLLETVKAGADSVETAQKEFAVRRDCLSAKKAVASLERRIPDPDDVPAKRSRLNETKRQKAVSEQISLVDHYVEGLDKDRRGLEMIKEDYDAVMEIGETLPKGTSVDALVDTTRISIENEQKAIDAVDAEIEAFDRQGVDEPQYQDFRRHLIDSYLSLAIPFDKALNATNAMSAGVSAQAKKTLEERLGRVRIVRLMCQLLFAIGWLLSLADKMYLDSSRAAAEAD